MRAAPPEEVRACLDLLIRQRVPLPRVSEHSQVLLLYYLRTFTSCSSQFGDVHDSLSLTPTQAIPGPQVMSNVSCTPRGSNT